jgi:site-specific DNA-methyltransferase (adenine-specific)
LNKILTGRAEIVLKDFPDNCIDLVVTSPPYDGIRSYEGYIFDFPLIAEQLFRTLKVGGVIVWIVSDETTDGSESCTSFKQALHFRSLGLKLHDTMIWRKSSPPLSHNRYEQHFEYMFVFSKEYVKTFNAIKEPKLYMDNRKVKDYRRNVKEGCDNGFIGQQKDKIKGNIWDIPVGGGITTPDKEAYEHPAIFPDKLAKDHIYSWSNEGDVVLDPMCGSGTVPKMAKLLHRNYIGIDISKKYCELAIKRINKHKIPNELFR